MLSQAAEAAGPPVLCPAPAPGISAMSSEVHHRALSWDTIASAVVPCCFELEDTASAGRQARGGQEARSLAAELDRRDPVGPQQEGTVATLGASRSSRRCDRRQQPPGQLARTPSAPAQLQVHSRSWLPCFEADPVASWTYRELT